MADLVYCTIAQLETSGVNAKAIASFGATQKNDALNDASRKIDSYLGARFVLPIVAFGADLRRCCAIIAAYDLLSSRGLNPEASNSDQNIRDRYTDELKWLQLVASGTVTPTGITDSSAPAITPGGSGPARVVSASSRGYSARGDSSRWPFQSD